MHLTYNEGKGGRPEKILLEDNHILFTVLAYALAVILIFEYI